METAKSLDMILVTNNIKEFERKFSQYIKKKHCIALSSGTAALEVALKALGIKEGDEVIIPNFTIIS